MLLFVMLIAVIYYSQHLCTYIAVYNVLNGKATTIAHQLLSKAIFNLQCFKAYQADIKVK